MGVSRYIFKCDNSVSDAILVCERKLIFSSHTQTSDRESSFSIESGCICFMIFHDRKKHLKIFSTITKFVLIYFDSAKIWIGSNFFITLMDKKFCTILLSVQSI